ncbi:MAG: hypothetical protein M3417_05155, partial [Actinomycetota bacterium]|nr:hypothetical protein [Actinomycetota bacterium]
MPSTRSLTLAAWIAAAVTTMLALGSVVLAVVEPTAPGAFGDPDAGSGGVGLAAIEAIATIAFGVLGAMVVSQQQRNPVGWLLGLIGLSFAILGTGNHVYWQVLLTTGDADALGTWAAWLCSWIWIPVIVPASTVLPLVFPTGHPLSRRWRALVWTAAVAGTVTLAGTAFVPGPIDGYPAAVNPLGIDSTAVEIIGTVGFVCLVPTALASIASLVIRFRRSRGVERQQLKWVAAAATLLPLAFSGAGLASQGSDGDAGYPILLMGLLIVAVTVAVAMLRYRLYDIDVVINRTLVYGALTATLAGTYLGTVLLLQLVLSGLTANSGLAVAGSTLAVA